MCKKLFFYSAIIIQGTLCFGAEEASKHISIVPFNYNVHADGAKACVRESMEFMCPLPEDPEKHKTELERLNTKLDIMLHNGYIMSQTKIIKDSMERVVLQNNGSVQGVMDFYIQAENQKGYIETLCTKPRNHTAHQKALINYALSALSKKGASAITSHVLEDDTDGQKPLKELGFTALPQGELEKSAKAVEFEYIHSDAQQ
jgi:hypothetical protein